MIHKIIFFILLFSISFSLRATPLLDDTFGKEGIASFSLSPGEDRGEIVLAMPDGKILVTAVTNLEGNSNIALLRLNANGFLDETFGKKGKTVFDSGGKDGVFGLVVQSDSKIVAGGFSEKNGNRNFLLVRFLADGNVDKTFGTEGITVLDFGGSDEIHYLVLGKNDKIIDVGFSEQKEKADLIVTRFLPDGKVDPSFGENGVIKENFSDFTKGFGLSLDSNNKIVVTGSVRKKEGEKDCFVARFLESGKKDETFGKNGFVPISFSPDKEDECAAVTVQKDEKIIAAGFARKTEQDLDYAIARLNKDGSLDMSFGDPLKAGYQNPFGKFIVDFKNGFDIAHAISVDNSGRIYISGESQLDPSFPLVNSLRYSILRLTPEGRQDKIFGENGLVIIDTGQKPGGTMSMTRDGNGKILLTGELGKKVGVICLRP